MEKNFFDQFDSTDSNSSGSSSDNFFDQFDAPTPKKKKDEDRGVLDVVKDLGVSLYEGAKGTGRMLGAAGNTVTGDLADVEDYADRQSKAAADKPQALQNLNADLESRRQKLGEDAGVLDSIGAVGGALANNPEGAAQFVIEQAPNSAVSLGSGLAGAKAGAVAGGTLGALLGPAGSAVGATVGGVGGFLGGMFLGNAALETGGKAIEKAEGGFTEAERGEAIKEGAVKGGVITAVDAATLGAGGLVAKGFAKEAIEAGARAEAKVLSRAGVDVASREAVESALSDAALRTAAEEAGKKAAQAATTLKNRLAAGGTGLTMETAGEGVGEYLGELAATGEADVYDAVIESFAGLSQSAVETAYNLKNAQGNDLDSRGIARASQNLEPDQEGEGGTAIAEGSTANAVTFKPDPATPDTSGSENVASATDDEAVRALKTPVQLTALDRAQELDSEIGRLTERLTELSPENGYGEAFDAERNEIATRAQELAMERDEIAKTWPKAVPGIETEFSTESGAKIQGQYAIMDAADLVTSNDENLKANPLYPKELQPRDRSRQASEIQISGIVGKLDPARLGVSADAATGAPIVGADGLVESGNARTIALKRVYQANGQKAEDYKSFLRANAQQFGLTPEQIDQVQKPVLVRVRSTPVNRAEFARQANASTVQRMSPSEAALSDASRLTSLEGLNPDENGDFDSSIDFIRQFMATLPITEQSDMLESDGRLSTTGYRRIQNAVLAKAYGDSPTLRRMTESRDDNLRNITKALTFAAPTIAAARERIASGSMYDADIASDLIQAVEGLSSIKQRGWTVDQELAQTDLTGPKYSEESAELLNFLDQNIRSPRRIAEFMQRYYEALEAAGDPNQGTMFDEPVAPTRQGLINQARGQNVPTTANTERGVDPEAAQAAQESGGQPENAPRNQGRNQGDEGPGSGTGTRSEESSREDANWVNYPKDSGTLGIPRAQMPQIKSEARGALVQFLKARGIDSESKSVPASELKPTQAEYSADKVKRFIESGPVDGSRSVLISSDNHVLDGHHQWMTFQAMGKEVPVIQLNAPIRELLEQVYEFPSVKRSEGSTDARTQAVADFKDALADLALIATKNTRLTMLPESTPGLMPTLVKLFDAAFKIVGYDAKKAIQYVKEQLKADEKTKKIWNRISNDLYRKAAQQAIEARPANDGLFAGTEKSDTALIDGKPYEAAKHNYSAPPVATFMPSQAIDAANAMIAKYANQDIVEPLAALSAEDRARAENLLKPILEKAAQAKVEYDQKIIDIAQRVGALGQQLAPLKGLKRAAEKLAREENFNVDGMKDMLRSTIVVASYADAQAVVDAIESEFELLRAPKNRTGDLSLRSQGKDVPAEDPAKYAGYSDIMVNVVMPNGTIAEIQINTPDMLAAKAEQGHGLYELIRAETKGSEKEKELTKASVEFYDAARAAAKNSASVMADERTGQRSVGDKPSEGARSSNTKRDPSGNRTYDSSTPSSSVKSIAKTQPSGNLSGTRISSPRSGILPKISENGYQGPDLLGDIDGIETNNQSGSSGPKSKAVQGTGNGQNTQRIRGRSGQGSLFADSDADPGTAGEGAMGSARPDGGSQANESGRPVESRNRAGRPVGVPAGRDIPPKSGRNYTFGPDDLSYEGSWAKKAEQNVQVVELLKQLQADARQATEQEQKILAKFTGWGSSEMANNLFGPKMDKVAEAMRNFDIANDAFNDNGGRPLVRNSRGFYNAFVVLNESQGGKLNFYQVGEITRDQLNKAKPDASARRWLDLRDRLKAALTPEEWSEASRSTQYAHYTSKAVVSSMWKAMERMGFKGGNVLEPGAGIGVFAGLMPPNVAANSVYTGIEYDSITGGVLKQLFPDERVLVESFVDSKLPKNFYDVAIGNPPFSSTKILSDPEYAKRAFSLHDYFFAKSIDRVKPGGLVVYVTSRYTMDKLDDKARKYLSERADLVGAIRLPQTAFKQNAGTEVVTDVIFLRKKVPGETFEQAKQWGKVTEVTTPEGPAMINEYFAQNPSMVLGKNSLQGSQYSANEYTVLPLEGDIEGHFAKAIESLPQDIYVGERGSAAEAAQVRELDFNPKAKKEGNYYVSDSGALMIREGGVGQRVQLRSEKDIQLIKDYVPLRDALKQAHYDQLNNGDWEQSLKSLQKAYEAFTKKHGPINQFRMKTTKVKAVDEETGETYQDEVEQRTFPVLEKLRDDPDYTLVAALEKLNEDNGEITPSEFLTGRVLGKQSAPEVNTPIDALLSSLNDVGKVDIGLIAARVGLSEKDTIEALGTAIYEDPESGWTTADDYLSGNVKNKLDAAREAARTDKRFERNISALEAVQPAPKTPSQINAGLGMNWIPGEVYSQFLQELANVRAEISFNERTRTWDVKELSGGKSLVATSDWGTDSRNVTSLVDHALTGRPIRITTTVGSGKDKKTVFDSAATEAANQKLEIIKDRFQSWLWQDADRADRLVRIYNDKFNTTVPRTFDGRHLTLPGASAAMHIFDHVKRGAWRIIQKGNTYLAHAVGSGKTFQMVISAMEQKRLGLIKKPMMVVPNHMLKQFAHEWQMLYPAARLMIADEANFTGDNRRRFVSRVALSDLDGVIITHSAFKLLDLDPEFKKSMIEEQLDYMRAALEEAGGDASSPGKSRDPKIKRIEKQIENFEQKLELAMSSEGKDKNVRFDELGVDMLYVDEAHEYRKLDFTTNRQVKGINPMGSQRAFDLYMKAQYLEQKTPGRSLVMASGTPVTNTLAELYTVQKFMDRQSMVDKGIEDFDSWAAMFGRERTVLEPNAGGKYEPVTRFSKFVNVPELTQMFREFADVLTADNLAVMLGDKRPKVQGGGRKIIVTPKTQDYAAYQVELQSRVQASKNWKPSKDQPNNPDPMIRIIGDGRLAAIDMRFINPALPDDPESKLNVMIDDVIAAFKETQEFTYNDKETGKAEPNKGATMMVFSDLGFGADVAKNRGFNARAWFEKRLRDAGIPAGQVAFMQDYKKSSAKLKLFKDVNAGRVRLLVGSSKNMGTGVNAQQRLYDEFHLDSPWFPADLEQREGRIVRQGNKNPNVRIRAYAAKGTYDENMWKMLASKQFFIDQALSGDQNLREIEDLDSQSQFDLAAGMVAEDPRVLQLAGIRADIEKMERLYQAHEEQRYRHRDQYNAAKNRVSYAESRLPEMEAAVKKVTDLKGDNFKAVVGKATITDREEFGQALIDQYKALMTQAEEKPVKVAEISGFPVVFSGQVVAKQFFGKMMLNLPVPVEVVHSENADPQSVAMRAQNAVMGLIKEPAKLREVISEAKAQMDALSSRLEAPFPMAGLLADKIKEGQELEAEITADKSKDQPDTDNTTDDQGEPETVLSRSSVGNDGVSVGLPELKKLAAAIKKRLPNLPEVVVLEAAYQAPKTLREYIVGQGAASDVEGAYHNGKLYLFASGLSDLRRAEFVLAEHEAAHYGLRAIFGDRLKAVMNQIYNENASIRKAASVLQARGKLTNAQATEEVLVDMPSSELVKLKGWKKITVAIRNWLDAAGLTRLAEKIDAWLSGSLDDQQRADLYAADLVRAARAYVAGTTPTGVVRMAEVRLSRSPQNAMAELAARFKAETGDDIATAGIKLAGQEVRRASGKVEKDLYTPEQVALFDQWDAMRNPSSKYLFHTTPAANLESIKANGLVVGSKARFEGVSSPGRISLSANEAAAKYYSGASDVMLRVAKGFEFKDLGPDLLAGEGTYTTGTNIPAQALEIKQGRKWVKLLDADTGTRLSRAPAPKAVAERANEIISKKAASAAPLESMTRIASRLSGLERLTGAIYDKAAYLLDRYTPETVKAGVVSDYGVPDAVIDQRVLLQGRQRVQLRKAGNLVEKLSTLTREESRVAYEWLNEGDSLRAKELMNELPADSVKVLQEVQQMIDRLSKEAVALGQLDAETYERNKFAYLRRSYAKHIMEQTEGEKARRSRVLSILGDQYKGRGLTDAVPMSKIQNIAPDWWGRKMAKGKADTALKGQKFVRLERRKAAGQGTVPLPGMQDKADGKLLEVVFYPAGEPLPNKYADWKQAGTWEVRTVKGNDAVMWRDFTKAERESMGEVDEARFAIAKTLHGMIHDVEVGRYLEWLGINYAKKPGEEMEGDIVEASERYKDTFKPTDWVQVPETKVPGTNVLKYGKLAGRYIPGPIWNDLRQVVNGQFRPFGDTYAKILSLWKTSKTALSPAVHMNNIMSNFVMADWHGVTAGHVAKALRLVLAANKGENEGLLAGTGKAISRAVGISDREAAREVLNRYSDSGGDVGSWVTNEIATDQLEPLLKSLEVELAVTAGASHQAQTGVFAALQHALMLRFPSAWEAFKPSAPARAIGNEAKALISLYQTEDDIFRLAAWLRAKEQGMDDFSAGKASRKSFLDYNINAPWIQAMRNSAWPFISFTYRAIPMMLEVAGKRPHKLLKLMMVAGALNALGSMLAGGEDDEEERKLLPEEKAGKIWGMVPKLIRMPWNDQFDSPVYLDIRRFVPVGDIFDVGATNAAIPILPYMQPGGPLVLFGEVILNKSMFTGKPITLETDTTGQQAAKTADYLYKAFAPNILGLPGTYATTGVMGSLTGRTDAFGREMSTAQAVASSFGIKLGSYPKDVLRRNLNAKTQAQLMEIQRNISQLKRQRQTGRIDAEEFAEKVRVELEKKAKVQKDLAEKLK